MAILTTRILDVSAIESEGWTDAIISLDGDTMAATLLEAGVELPEAKRREGLRAQSTTVVALLADDYLAGYIEFCNDRSADHAVYLSSLQLREEHRTGRPLAILIVECARVLHSRPFTRLHSAVHRNNHQAISLYANLGFQLLERQDNRTMLDVSADRCILDSDRLRRLEQHVAGVYNRMS